MGEMVREGRGRGRVGGEIDLMGYFWKEGGSRVRAGGERHDG